MTERARVSQADMERATKAVKKAGFRQARITIDLANQRIDIFLGESPPAKAGRPNPWDGELGK